MSKQYEDMVDSILEGSYPKMIKAEKLVDTVLDELCASKVKEDGCAPGFIMDTATGECIPEDPHMKDKMIVPQSEGEEQREKFVSTNVSGNKDFTKEPSEEKRGYGDDNSQKEIPEAMDDIEDKIEYKGAGVHAAHEIKINPVIFPFIQEDKEQDIRINPVFATEEDTAYQKFFRKMLDNWGVSSPAELDDEKKKEFFNAVDKAWKAKKESD